MELISFFMGGGGFKQKFILLFSPHP